MDYLVVGLNHRTAPIQLRERLAFSELELNSSLQALVQRKEIAEATILSTCNRVEVYAVSPKSEEGLSEIKTYLALSRGLALQDFEPHLYQYQSQNAVLHGFRVAASLDSMVLGETEILGQVKRAYAEAHQSKTTGVYLNPFLQQAISVSKKVRTETGISSHAVSLGSAAVELAKQIFGDLNKKIAVLGMGKIGNLVLQSMEAYGAKEILKFNRTTGEAGVQPLDDFWAALTTVDVVITSLSGSQPYVTLSAMKSVMEKRKSRPLFFIDLGVPRNVEADVHRLNNVYLYNIDDLESVIAQNRKLREAEAAVAEKMVAQEAAHFYGHIHLKEPTIIQLGKKFDAIRSHELERTLKKLDHLSEVDKLRVSKLSEAIVSRILHDPVQALKSEEEDFGPKEMIRKIFNLEEI